MKNQDSTSHKKVSVSPRAGLVILIVFVILSVMMFAFSALFSSEGFSDAMANASAEESSDNSAVNNDKMTIIIDAGHGGEDPGAVANNVKEKEVNLKISKKLEELFSNSGYKVVMTRKDDVLLYNQGEESQKKQHDLKNRVAVAGEYENPVFISIHANKFYLESCKGAQVFFGKNEQSSKLADSIQSNIKTLQTDNERVIKDGTQTTFILNRLTCPAVLIECGFLSNGEDAKNLQSEEYINSLAESIYSGFTSWLESSQNVNKE